MPLGAGGIPSKWNFPRILLSLVNYLSPSNTWINTPGWLSEYVVKVYYFLVGIVVFLGIKTVIISPAVSNPKLKGVTSKSNKS